MKINMYTTNYLILLLIFWVVPRNVYVFILRIVYLYLINNTITRNNDNETLLILHYNYSMTVM